MQVEIYLNTTFGSAFLDYEETDDLRCAWRGELDDLPEADDAACHVVWAMFNLDPEDAETAADLAFRERTYQDRSLSVADVVTLDGQRSYAVTSLGFKPIGRTLTGDPIVGPEGDDALREGAQADNAGEAVAKGLGRMASIMGEEIRVGLNEESLPNGHHLNTGAQAEVFDKDFDSLVERYEGGDPLV